MLAMGPTAVFVGLGGAMAACRFCKTEPAASSLLGAHRYGASMAMFFAIWRSQRSPFASRRSLS